MTRQKSIFRRSIRILMLGILLTTGCSRSPQPKTESAPAGERAKGSGAVPAGVRLADRMPSPGPAKNYEFPKPAKLTLANGLKVFVISDSEQPMVSVRLALTQAGAVNDPAGRPGVAAMTADLLGQGTASRSAEQIAQAIDFVGGSLSATADNDGIYVSVSVVKRDFALAMDLLSDVVIRPAFRKEEIERRRQQAMSNLEVEYSDPGYVADVLIERLVYGQYPYGLPNSGTLESVQKISREDLVRFWQEHLGPEHSLLAFAGDITPEAAFAASEKFLGAAAWPKHGTQEAILPAPVQAQGMHIVLVDKPDANQSQIRLGRLGIQRNHPDYVPLFVTNRIFGGGFNSRLSTEVRQKKGLTYGAYSNFKSYQRAGDFSASTFTRTEATVEAARLMVDLIAKMSTGELGPNELAFARDYIAGVFPIQTETSDAVASRILAIAQYNLPADYYDNYQRRVLAITPAEIKDMSNRYFDAGNIVMVLVGNIKQFRDSVRKEFPKARVEELPFDKVDLLSPTLRRQ